MGPPSYMWSVIDRSVVMQRMTVHNHITKNNDISIQFLYFTSHNKQYCNNTKQTWQSKNFVHIAKHDAIYTKYNTQSGPVYLSCPHNTASCHCCWHVNSGYIKLKGFHVLFVTRGPHMAFVKCF